MFNKSLITFFVTIMICMPAMAVQPVIDTCTGWSYTVETIHHWECKPATVNPIPVKMKIVMWADVYWNQDNHCIEIVQVNGDTFVGCADLKICVNFAGLKIKAEFVEIQDVAQKYYLSLVPASESDSYGGDDGKTELIVPGVHLTGNNLPVRLCVKATGVDPQAMAYSSGQLVQIGNVYLTLVPTGTP